MSMTSRRFMFAALAGVATMLAGCGKLDRNIAGWTGKGAETCVDGVLYLQFTSGVTVKYKPDGTVATCGRAQ